MTTKELSLVEMKLKSAQERLLAVSPVPRAQAERAMQVLITLSRGQLKDCTLNSVLMAALNVAKVGLNPDPQLGHVWIIPRKLKGVETATMQIGAYGHLALARRGGMGAINMGLIHANDHFDYRDGLEPRLEHKPWWLCGKAEAGDLIGGWIVAEIAPGAKQVTVIPASEFERSRDRSQAAKYGTGPWTTDYESMCRVVLIRRAEKTWPQTAEMAAAVAIDEREERGEPQDIYDLGEIEDASESLPEGKRIMAGKAKAEAKPEGGSDPPGADGVS